MFRKPRNAVFKSVMLQPSLRDRGDYFNCIVEGVLYLLVFLGSWNIIK